MPPPLSAASLVAVDIGNSRIKLGRFDPVGRCAASAAAGPLPIVVSSLPEPTETCDLTLADRQGDLPDLQPLADWCRAHLGPETAWRVASVHRGATKRFTEAVRAVAESAGYDWPLRQISYRDLPLPIRVDEPSRVGIDRLLAALAANHLREPGRAAIVIDSGSATTVDWIDADGAFRGGAILPGIAMAARALDEQTDALPRVAIAERGDPPPALGTSTIGAIESGLFWGAVGAIRELIVQLSAGLDAPPEVFFTGGASLRIAKILAETENWPIRNAPHLVLAGVALVDQRGES